MKVLAYTPLCVVLYPDSRPWGGWNWVGWRERDIGQCKNVCLCRDLGGCEHSVSDLLGIENFGGMQRFERSVFQGQFKRETKTGQASRRYVPRLPREGRTVVDPRPTLNWGTPQRTGRGADVEPSQLTDCDLSVRQSRSPNRAWPLNP